MFVSVYICLGRPVSFFFGSQLSDAGERKNSHVAEVEREAAAAVAGEAVVAARGSRRRDLRACLLQGCFAEVWYPALHDTPVDHGHCLRRVLLRKGEAPGRMEGDRSSTATISEVLALGVAHGAAREADIGAPSGCSHGRGARPDPRERSLRVRCPCPAASDGSLVHVRQRGTPHLGGLPPR